MLHTLRNALLRTIHILVTVSMILGLCSPALQLPARAALRPESRALQEESSSAVAPAAQALPQLVDGRHEPLRPRAHRRRAGRRVAVHAAGCPRLRAPAVVKALLEDLKDALGLKVKGVGRGPVRYGAQSRVIAAVRRYVNAVAAYAGGGRGTVPVRQIARRELELISPAFGDTAAQRAALAAAQEWAWQSRGVIRTVFRQKR